MPTQNRSACGKKITEWLKMKVSQITLRWAGLKVQNGSKNLAIVHGRVRDDVEKKMWMKNIDKWRITTTKWRSTSQKPPEVLPSKYHHWEILTFDLKKNDKKLLFLIACDHYNKTYVIYIIYVIHNFNYLWLLMIIDNYF